MRENTKEKEGINKNQSAKTLLVVGRLKATANSAFQKFSPNFPLKTRKLFGLFKKRSQFDHSAVTKGTANALEPTVHSTEEYRTNSCSHCQETVCKFFLNANITNSKETFCVIQVESSPRASAVPEDRVAVLLWISLGCSRSQSSTEGLQNRPSFQQ